MKKCEVVENCPFVEQIESLHSAFPNKDITGHHDYHQALIDAKLEEAKFWREVRLDLMKKGLWGILAVLVGLALAKLGWGKLP